MGLLLFISLLFNLFKPLAYADVRPDIRVLSFRIRDEPETLDWNRAHSPVESYILMNLMEGLVAIGPNSNVIPTLAQSWTLSADGTTYTFKLRPGVKWSDGVPLRAQDFVYSWKRLLSPLTAASYAYFLFDIEGAEAYSQGKQLDFDEVGIKALNDATLQVKLSHPVAYWINIPAFWVTFPIRQDIVEKYGSSWDLPGRMVTLGPYCLISHDIGSSIVMRANAFYYGKRGNVDQIIARIVKDDTEAKNLYEAGELDILGDIATVDPTSFRHTHELKTFHYLKTAYLGFVTAQFPLSNLHLRKAIAMAIDKREFSKALHGGQEPATSFIPPDMPNKLGYSKTMGLTFNPSQAKVEYKLSGLDTGEPLTLNYLLPDWDKSLQTAEVIQAQLKKYLGIRINLKSFDNKTYRVQLDLHIFPLFDATWTADYPDPDNFLSIFLGDSGNNRTTWSNPAYNRLIEEARYSQKLDQRKNAYLELQKKLLVEEAVIVPLYYEPNVVLVKPWIKNFSINPMNYLYLKMIEE